MKQITRTKIVEQLIEINEKIFFYPKLRRHYLSTLPNQPLILDIGSNKGQSIDLFKKIRPAAFIHGFEPNPDLYTFLKNKYQPWNDKIIINNCGISNECGTMLFNINQLDLTSTYEELNLKSHYLRKKAFIIGYSVDKIIAKTIVTKVVTIANYISEKQIKKIDLIKIDTEGHEYKCLEGLFNNGNFTCQIDRIQIENHRDDMYLNNESFEKIEKLLSENNFEKEISIRHGFGDFYEIVYKKN